LGEEETNMSETTEIYFKATASPNTGMEREPRLLAEL
jgi:hypothetical protein